MLLCYCFECCFLPARNDQGIPASLPVLMNIRLYNIHLHLISNWVSLHVLFYFFYLCSILGRVPIILKHAIPLSHHRVCFERVNCIIQQIMRGTTQHNGIIVQIIHLRARKDRFAVVSSEVHFYWGAKCIRSISFFVKWTAVREWYSRH